MDADIAYLGFVFCISVIGGLVLAAGYEAAAKTLQWTHWVAAIAILAIVLGLLSLTEAARLPVVWSEPEAVLTVYPFPAPAYPNE